MASAETSVQTLRRLAAEVRADLGDIERIAHEVSAAKSVLSRGTPSNLEVYGTGKLLHDFYTGIERAFEAIPLEFVDGIARSS